MILLPEYINECPQRCKPNKKKNYNFVTSNPNYYSVSSQSWDSAERGSFPQGDPELLLHVQILRRHPVWQSPVERLDERSHHQMNHPHRERQPRADPPPSPERDVLEIPALEVHARPQEPLGLELHRLSPVAGVPPDGPCVDEHLDALRDDVAEDLDIRLGPVCEEEWGCGVEPHRLLDDRLEIREPVDIRFLNRSFSPNHRQQFLACLFKHSGLTNKFSHRPLGSDRRCIASSYEQILLTNVYHANAKLTRKLGSIS